MTLDEYLDSLRSKRIAVVGAGVSNIPLIRLLTAHGCRVAVCDKRDGKALEGLIRQYENHDVSFRLGESYLDDLNYDLIFRTPGLHPSALKAAPASAVISSEMELFFRFCPCRTIAITGSDGKTTTSTLIAELLKAAGKNVYLGGNIGRPLLEEIPHMKKNDIAVLELSSFQLHSMSCSPDVAVVTNISPNHLDVHHDYDDYIRAKKSIFLNQKPQGRLVLNLDNEHTRAFADEAKCSVVWFSRRERPQAGYYCDGKAIYRDGEKILDVEDILLPGVHNIENLMAAFAAVDGEVPVEVFRTVAESFGGVPHRIELVRTLRGVRYYNDSIASSPTRTIAGLRSFEKPVILIAGGHDKHVPFDELAKEMLEHVKLLLLTGETAQTIKNAVISAPGYSAEKLPIYVIDDFRDTVLKAAQLAQNGDVVILSPACSSFDRFKNFVERGDTFRKIVEELE